MSFLRPSAGLRGALVALTLVSCSSSSSSSPSSSSGGPPNPFPMQPKATTLFSKAVTQVVVEVDYAAGAEPYVGAHGGQDGIADIWGLTRTNTRAIFETKTVTVPTQLSQMEPLADVEAKNYSDAEILEVAKAHRDTLPGGDLASFYVVFLNGNYVTPEGSVDEDRLAVSIGETGVVAMFKPAINKPAGAKIPPPAYVEQLALIHELGHAVGFVDNGVPVAESNKAHIDAADLHHCSNKQCAMASGIDTVQGAAPYAMSFVRYQTSVLIGQECLSDARILSNRLTQ